MNPLDIHVGSSSEDLKLKGAEIAVVRGVHEGNIYVFGGSTLILRGIVKGSIYIEETGSAFIHGIVTGDVTNNGGRLKHYGVIKGRLNRLAGETVIWPRSIIGEIKH